MAYSEKQQQMIRKAAWVSMLVSLFLIAIKLFAWLLTRSLAMQAALLDAVQDFMMSLMNLCVIRHATEPADDAHRFGHGKLESLMGLSQSLIIGATGLYLAYQATERFAHPIALEYSVVGIIVMILSCGVGFGLVRFQQRIVAETGSVAIAADSVHYRTDIITNLAVMLSLLLAPFDFFWFLDPLVGLAIAIYILHSAYALGVTSVAILMDHELPPEDQAKIIAMIGNEPGVLGFHKLKSRSSGSDIFIQFHLELDGNMPLKEAHLIADRIEQKMIAVFPQAEVTIHQDPR